MSQPWPQPRGLQRVLRRDGLWTWSDVERAPRSPGLASGRDVVPEPPRFRRSPLNGPTIHTMELFTPGSPQRWTLRSTQAPPAAGECDAWCPAERETGWAATSTGPPMPLSRPPQPHIDDDHRPGGRLPSVEPVDDSDTGARLVGWGAGSRTEIGDGPIVDEGWGYRMGADRSSCRDRACASRSVFLSGSFGTTRCPSRARSRPRPEGREGERHPSPSQFDSEGSLSSFVQSAAAGTGSVTSKLLLPQHRPRELLHDDSHGVPAMLSPGSRAGEVGRSPAPPGVDLVEVDWQA